MEHTSDLAFEDVKAERLGDIVIGTFFNAVHNRVMSGFRSK